ncbi:sigma-70 family RNA polymerase sigma factor [Chitinophaga silvisoli]|uniref:Sigma-70 family RNA polymerase sigma factor n=2 Tax=Chitinophaga silvisoli TaxID=2291814 RepID=A0A3E1NWE7_9BACT|nr:sigma-70 family RNA polymerase sigma factor [Chitinophaga silvisoli]
MEQLKTIIEGCMHAQPRCQRLLYERYYAYALKIVFRYIYRYEKATEVVNDGFVKIFSRFDRFTYEEGENLEKMLLGWMRKIMVNTAIDELRRKNMIPEIGGIPEYVWEQPDMGQSAEQKLYYKELIILIKELPPSYQVVFNMYVIDGFSHQEIADKLNISLGTSKSNLSKAREHLKKKLNNGIQEFDICSF